MLYEVITDGVSAIEINVTIASGVIIGSTSTSTAAMTITGFPTGTTLTLINNGTIQGCGGAGGSGGSNSSGGGGGQGGPALSVSFATLINNTNGKIYVV